MKRTERRPLPSGRLSPTEATAWGVTAGAAGTGLLYATAGLPVAVLGAGNIGLYAGLYTASKRMGEVNTWIGSVVGAIPPVMGYMAAVGGGWAPMLHPESIAMGSLLFLWQFPHFFSLSYMHREDYSRGGFKMVACADATGSRSANLVWEYSLMLSALPVAAWAGGLTSSMFAVEGVAINGYLLYLAHRFKQSGGQTNANARRVFLCSLWYLPVLMAALVFHSKNWSKDKALSEDGARDGDAAAEEKTGVEALIGGAKRQLKELCVHEVVIEKLQQQGLQKGQGEDDALSTDQRPVLCPKVSATAAAKRALEVSTASVQAVVTSSTGTRTTPSDKQ
jgi:heme o synthase